MFRFLLAVLAVTFASATAAHDHVNSAKKSRKGPRLVIQLDSHQTPWTNKDLRNDPTNFQFAIVSDRTGGSRRGVFEDAVQRLNLLQPEFVMSVGDLISGYTEDPKEMDREWNEFDSLVDKLKMRFFYVPGNHDITNAAMAHKWKERYGSAYYHFLYGNVLFLCLNSMDPPQHQIGTKQIQWVNEVLDKHKKVQWTLVFLHSPMWHSEGQNRWNEIEALLKDRPYTVFAGHEHSYKKDVRQDRKHFTLATSGGGSGLRGTKFGEFDQIAWVTMTRQGPILANLLLSGILDENLTEGLGPIIGRISQSNLVTMKPIFLEKSSPRELAAQLRLVNDEDVPMSFSASWESHPYFKQEPRKIKKTLAPNSVEVVDVRISSSQDIDVDTFRFQELQYRLTLEYENLPQVESERFVQLPIDRIRDSRRVPNNVTVDGKLGDWPDLPYVVKVPKQVAINPSNWKGPEDSWFRFGHGYDDKYLYIAIEAHDDEKPTLVTNFFQGDASVILLDPRPADQREKIPGESEPKTFVIGLAPGSSMAKEYAVVPKGTLTACVATKDGFNTEIAIPHSALDEMYGEAWKSFRLNVIQIDTDGSEGWGSSQWWRPDWTILEYSYFESGVFQRK